MKFIFYVALICAIVYFTASWATNNLDDARTLVGDCRDFVTNVVANVDDYFHGVSNDNT